MTLALLGPPLVVHPTDVTAEVPNKAAGVRGFAVMDISDSPRSLLFQQLVILWNDQIFSLRPCSCYGNEYNYFVPAE